MKKLPHAILASALILFGALASGSAMAQRHHGHGGARVGIYFGAPVYRPVFYPPPYYVYPAYGYVPAPVAPPTYVEQGVVQAEPAPAQSQGDWYYCSDSGAYFPYVKECPAGWQRVPAQPPSG